MLHQLPFIKTQENLYKNANENLFSFAFSCICNFAIFVWIFMKFSPNCRTWKVGMIYTILGSFCLFFNWERAVFMAPNQARENPCHWRYFEINKKILSVKL